MDRKLINKLFETIPVSGTTEFRIRALGGGSYSVSLRELDEGRMKPYRPPEMKSKKVVKFIATEPTDLLEWLTALGKIDYLIKLDAAAKRLAEREHMVFGSKENLG